MIRFKARWVARQLHSLALDGYGYEKPDAVWTKDHKRMMRHIGKAMAQWLDVVVTFRKPTEADKIANAAEIGECLITGMPRQRRRTNGPQPTGDVRKQQTSPEGIRQVVAEAGYKEPYGP